MKRIYINVNDYLVIANDSDTSIDLRRPARLIYVEKDSSIFTFYSSNKERHIITVDYANILDEDGNPYASIGDFTNLIEGKTSGSSVFIADETNVIAIDLLNGASKDQNIDGSVTPVEFSYSPPAGFEFLLIRMVFYMEDGTVFDSNKFGGLTALTNGWGLSFNGVSAMEAKTNRELGTYMYDMQGVEIFGKVDKTMIGRFTFSKFTDGAQGITIREGQSVSTIVQDDLTGLIYLEAKIMGVLIKV